MTPGAPRDVFVHFRLVGRQWDRDLLQAAFLSSRGDVIVSTFVWSPTVDVQTDRLARASVLRLMGPATPSLGFMTPLFEQACKGANLIAMDDDRQRRLLPACCLSAARGLTGLAPQLAAQVLEGPSTGEPLGEAIDRHQDAVAVTFRLLCLWREGRLEADRWTERRARWADLREYGL